MIVSKKVMVPTAWYVTWDLYLNSPKDGHNIHLAGQNQKRYTDKAAAVKYLGGRKKAYSHLFTEISPQIPKEYENHFTVNGALLPGYTVEGQEPVKAEHTAAEVSEGGISLPEKSEKAFRAGETGGSKIPGESTRCSWGNEKEGGYAVMNVLMVEPGKVPYAVDIGEGLEALQAAVGGDIQAVYPYAMIRLPLSAMKKASSWDCF